MTVEPQELHDFLDFMHGEYPEVINLSDVKYYCWYRQ